MPCASVEGKRSAVGKSLLALLLHGVNIIYRQTMKEALAIIIVVLALAALAAAHPYKLDGDIQSSKDLASRPLAPFQEYIAGLMQGKKPESNDSSNQIQSKLYLTPCIN